MKRDWDDRARQNDRFFIRSSYHQTEEEFWRSGQEDCRSIIQYDGDRFRRICGGRSPSELSVLEIGCGIGRITKPMSRIFGRAVGVDVSTEMIERARIQCRDAPRCEFYVNSGSDLSILKNGSFDFCCSYIVFQHIPDKEIIYQYIQEVSRVLKGGSLFRFQVHGQSSKNPEDGTTWNGVHFSQAEMHEIARQHHFTIIEEDGQHEQYYWLTFELSD
ncbi:class I SAM-dependent methyltransferase [bacterium]|nr:class I SAM-dependent methyltransferase [bacterium]